MKFTNKADGTVVEAITFDELVQHGRDSGAKIVNGMPWSFNYKHFPVTHENDQCYIVAGRSGVSLPFTPHDMLVEPVCGSFLRVLDAATFDHCYVANSVTFEQLMQYGIAKGSTAPGGKPMPFEYFGFPVEVIDENLIHVSKNGSIVTVTPGSVLTFAIPTLPPTKVNPEDITAVIEHTYFFTGDRATHGCPQHESLKLLTFCVLVLKNGFTVTGTSACADPLTFNAETGRQVAYDNARDQIWPLLGYQLKDRLHGRGAS